MRTRIVVLLLAIGVLLACNSKGRSSRDAKAADFKVTKFSDLPVDVRNALVSAALNRDRRDNGQFADPGQKWNATDVIYHGNVNLPRRRLIFGGMVDGDWFVYYEHGGQGKHEHLVALSNGRGAQVSIVANMFATNRWSELKEVKHALKTRGLNTACF